MKNISSKRTCKVNKTFMHRVISHYNILRIVEDISMDAKDAKDRLKKFSKKIQGEEHMTYLVLD